MIPHDIGVWLVAETPQKSYYLFSTGNGLYKIPNKPVKQKNCIVVNLFLS